MGLIPNMTTSIITGDAQEVIEDVSLPSRTYAVDFDKKRVVGYVDGVEAVKQAALMILQTERFEHQIYTWSYGIEANRVTGRNYAVVESEIRQIIKEALTADARITDVTNFTLRRVDKRTMLATFTIITIFGETTLQTEVTT